MKPINLQAYKIAKNVVRDAPRMLKVIDLAIRALDGYKHYNPVKHLLGNLKTERSVIKVHYDQAVKIVEKKGIVDG